jgi:hypothetical protein
MSLFGRRSLLPFVCALFVLIPPAVAYAADVQINYAQGVNGVGGAYHTSNPTYARRAYNQVWHQSGRTWTVWYQDTSGNPYCVVQNTSNPTKCSSLSDNKMSAAQNINDNSGVTWTAQTTIPV